MLAVLAGALAARVLYQVSVQPGTLLVKLAFERKPEVNPPPGFGPIASAVMQRRVAVPVSGGPTAHLDLYTPATGGTRVRPIILWVHGGGFVSNSSATVRDYAILLAHAGYTVASLDYSLAPGARYPTPIRQGNAALRYLTTNAGRYGGDPSRIVLGGDSAGAQIAGQLAAVQTNPALAAAMRLTPALEPSALRSVALFCGLYDLRTVGATGFPVLRTALWSYTGVRDWTAYSRIDELSVTKQATSDYPPVFLTVGDADPLRTQSTELATALRRRGVPVRTLYWTGSGDHLGHEYQFDFELPQAREALRQTLAFLAETTGTGG